MDIVLTAVMYLTVVFADPEGDGTFNYLFDRRHGATDREYMIAHSYHEDMGLKPGDTVYAKVEAKCTLVWALDETPKGMEGAFPYGVPRRSYICNADRLIINGKEFISLVRGQK